MTRPIFRMVQIVWGGLSSTRAVFLVALSIALTVPAHATNNEIVGAALKQLAQEKPISTGSSFADANRDRIRAFYASRSFKPIWSRDNGPKGKARALLRELQTSTAHALSPALYGTAEIEKLMASTQPDDLARLDFLLSGALVDYAHDLLNGRATTAAALDTNKVVPILLDPAKLIEEAAESGDVRQVIGNIVGKDRRYLRLVSKMVEFIRMQASGFWPTGDIAKSTKDMRRALALTGDMALERATSDAPMDGPLREALKLYQARNGLSADGTVGPATARALTKPLAERIKKLKVNVERRRWQNKPSKGAMVYFNIIDQSLKLVKDDRTVGSLDLVEDAALFRELPTFYGTITAVSRPQDGTQSALSLQFSADAAQLPQNTGFRISGDAAGALNGLATILSPEDLATLRGLKPGGKATLSKPVPLFVTYLTAWATRDGTLQLREDVYDRDSVVATKLGF
ncbi:MAG: peptidoglycan-binding protein [Pseudomonadota bacterium]